MYRTLTYRVLVGERHGDVASGISFSPKWRLQELCFTNIRGAGARHPPSAAVTTSYLVAVELFITCRFEFARVCLVPSKETEAFPIQDRAWQLPKA